MFYAGQIKVFINMFLIIFKSVFNDLNVFLICLNHFESMLKWFKSHLNMFLNTF